jgi:5-formyltetrahydrofolate cyclo-ligase
VHDMPASDTPSEQRRAGQGTGAAIDKASLRRTVVAARMAMSPSERVAAGRLIRDQVLEMPEVSAAGTVAAYYSVGTEPDTHGLVFALWKRGSYVVLPVLLPDGDLDWASYEGPDSLAPGPRGVLQPVEPVRGPGTVARADVVLVPALAVDASGHRLGRGGGSFDRALARVGGQVPTIGLIYDSELLPSVPAEPHDRAVRAIARPSHGITWLLSPGNRRGYPLGAGAGGYGRCGISGAPAQLSLAVCCCEC